MRKIIILFAVTFASLSLHAGAVSVPNTGLSRADGTVLLKTILDTYAAQAQDLANQRTAATAEHDQQRAGIIDLIRACAGDAACISRQEAQLKDVDQKYGAALRNLDIAEAALRTNALEQGSDVVMSVLFEALNERIAVLVQKREIEIMAAPSLVRSARYDCSYTAGCTVEYGAGVSQSHFTILNLSTQKIADVTLVFAMSSAMEPPDLAQYLSDGQNNNLLTLGLVSDSVDSLVKRMETYGARGESIGIFESQGMAEMKANVGLLIGTQNVY